MSGMMADNSFLSRRKVAILLYVLLLAILLTLASFMWQGYKAYDFGDEGFLWYGVKRVLLGAVPIRDFMAYDPGRYYWSAGLMALIGDNGIISLRISVAIFQIIGLSVGLVLIAQSAKYLGKERLGYLALSGIILIAWMFPRHKLYDISLSIFTIGVLTLLISAPSAWRYFLSGVGIGTVAFFGRNHGVYGLVGSVGVMLWLSMKRSEGPTFFKGIVLWGGGVVIGFLPVLLAVFLVPGFASAFKASISFLFEQKATNLPLPIPWPWTVNFSTSSLVASARGVLIGLFFIGIVAYGVLGIAWVVLRKVRNIPVPPAVVASAFVALPYAHFAYSRADVGHLAQGIFPLLIGLLVLLATCAIKTRWAAALALAVASLWIVPVYHPGWQCENAQCVTARVSGSNLQVDPGIAANIKLLRDLTAQYAPEGRSVIVTPFWPGAYPLLDRKSPMWETFALFPRSEGFEKMEIERIKAAQPGFVFVISSALDGRDELRFRNTHPLIYQYILDNFERVRNNSSSVYEIYRASGSGG